MTCPIKGVQNPRRGGQMPPYLFLEALSRAAPDFANGLFLTAANLGCVLGTLCLYGEEFLLGTENSHRKGGWLR